MAANTNNHRLSKQQVAVAIHEYCENRKKISDAKVRAIKVISKRKETATPLPQRFLRDVPFLPSKRAAAVRTLPDGTTIEIVASAAGRPTDRDMLLVVIVFFDAFYGLSKEELKEVAEGGALAEISIPVSQLRWWHNGRTADLKMAALRLSSFAVNYSPTTGDIITHRYFAEFKIQNNLLIALIDRDMAKRTLRQPWNIDIEPFLGLRTGVGRALFLMLAPDHRTHYNLIDLAVRLGLPVETCKERRDSVTDIITGFKDIETSGTLTILHQQERSSRNNIEVSWSVKTAQFSTKAAQFSTSTVENVN